MFFLCMLQNLLCITLVPRLISKREATPKNNVKSQVKKAKLLLYFYPNLNHLLGFY